MKCINPLLLAGVLATATGVHANSLNPVVEKSAAINDSALKTQGKIDSISDSMQSKLQQFKTLNKEIDGLMVYNSQLDKQIQNQLAEMADINASMDQVSVIERQITPLMLNMITGLEQFVALDVPFLLEERKQRVSKLREMMERADVTSSEKFRRVLEAYQVEVEYGRTIEAYPALINVAGQEREVDFLRIGRLELMYVTKDRKMAGIWEKESKQFKELPDTNISQINKALRIARKQLAPDMLTLPINAAK
ncbi:DUF3450 domain-containing protein [Pseudoalteromonas sp. SS15]|uniref:DUF3450 domain-containing protein n=1 Tax=Pseudoalteromonas sp. SS15 TaxID=3139393 RepID=UPI003BA8FFC2